MALLIKCPSCSESVTAPDIGPAYCNSCGWQSGKETEEPSALDRNTIETRTMLALEKIAVALEKLNLDKYKTTKQVVRGHHETWHQGSGHTAAKEESTIFDIVSKLVDLIDAASDTHGSIGSAFTPEYQTAYKKACYILSREPHEMLR